MTKEQSFDENENKRNGNEYADSDTQMTFDKNEKTQDASDDIGQEPQSLEQEKEQQEGESSEEEISSQQKEKQEIPDLTGLTEEDLFKKPEHKFELKNKLKALLFASAKPLTLAELTRLVRKRDRRPVLYCLRLLREEYNTTKDEPLILLDDNEWTWRLTLKERYVPVVEKIVTQTELPKSVIETLAVIAWKAPVTQSEVIHVRTNKAYQHIKDLEEAGYITSEKFGRTKLLKLTQKFFDYFDITREQLQKEIQAMLPEKKEAIHEAVKAKGEEVYEEDAEEQHPKESNEVNESYEEKPMRKEEKDNADVKEISHHEETSSEEKPFSSPSSHQES